MGYKYYGADLSGIYAENDEYPGINTVQDLYDAMSEIWCEYSCAPRYRKEWSKENMTLGQCSITSFLVQDIFGGGVYGVPREEGVFHCFNVVDGKAFDITSEQYGDEVLTYTTDYEQSREEHFANQEKYERYKYLCDKLHEYCERTKR
jgi:hypothetical protein